jgi:hypothetical protein
MPIARALVRTKRIQSQVFVINKPSQAFAPNRPIVAINDAPSDGLLLSRSAQPSQWENPQHTLAMGKPIVFTKLNFNVYAEP